VTNGAVGGDKTYDWKTMEEAQTQGTPPKYATGGIFQTRGVQQYTHSHSNNYFPRLFLLIKPLQNYCKLVLEPKQKHRR